MPRSAQHLFLAIRLTLPNRKTISTYAFIDNGATNSFVSLEFVKNHQIPVSRLATPLPVLAIDNRPLVSGLMTHDTVLRPSTGSHHEMLRLGLITCPYPVILGMDWLKRHNPAIDWVRKHVDLSHCNPQDHTLDSSSPTGLSRNASLYSDEDNERYGFQPYYPSHIECLRVPRTAGLATQPADDSSDPSPPTDLPGHCQNGPFASFVSGATVIEPPVLDPRLNIELLPWKRFCKVARNKEVGVLNRLSDFQIGARLAAEQIASTSPGAPPGEAPHRNTDNLFPDDSDPLPPNEAADALPDGLKDFADVFSAEEAEHLADHRPFDLKIDLEEGKTPPFGPLYSLSRDERAALFIWIEKNLDKGFIRKSQSAAASPILFAKKKNGDLRLCVDYRALNKITKKNRFPLPLVNDLLANVRGCSVFTKLDLKHAYNLVRIAEGDEWKTAFRTHYGLFEYCVMPFGLTNAPANFQAFIQDTLRDLLDICCVVYLDDILIFSRNAEEHQQHVRAVLERLRKAKLFANLDKCEFSQTEVEYLGFLLSADGLRMHPEKLSTISDWRAPRSVKEIQSFLGFTNFYRRFIDHYAETVIPLNRLTHKNVHPDPRAAFTLPDDALAAFEKLKTAFLTGPVLRHFDFERACTVVTDASDFALAAILHQPDDNGDLHPVAFYSRKFSPAEINYDVYDKELLGVVEAFREWRHWLIGTQEPIQVCCDHKNLEYFMDSRVLNRRQARWSMFLTEFNFRLSHFPGTQNPADAPSRRADYVPREGDDVLRQQHQALLKPHHYADLFPDRVPAAPENVSATYAAPSLFILDSSELREKFLDAYKTDTEWREGLLAPNSLFTEAGGTVYHDGRLFVPAPLRAEILHSRHDSVIVGHPGRARTLELVQRDFSWPGMTRYVRTYVSTCVTCKRIKVERHQPYGLLKPLDIPSRPWASISIDMIVKLPLSHGCDSILVVCDRMLKTCHLIPTVESITAEDLARLFITHIFRLHGLPESIVSDRGPVFVSQFWRALLKHLGIEPKTSTAYHPQTDGQTERTNQTIETTLRAYVSYQQEDWVDYLPLAEFAFNNLRNASTNVSPFYASYGFHPSFTPSFSAPASNPSAESFAKRIAIIQDELRAELEHAQQQYSLYANRHRIPPPSFEENDLVWLLRRNIKTTRPSDKLDYRRIGPYKIIKKYNHLVYKLRLPRSMSRLHPVFHVSLLEPFDDPSVIPDRAPAPRFAPIHLDDEENGLVPVVDDVVDCRRIGRRVDYLVNWANLDESERSWVPFTDLPKRCNELIERFHRRNPKVPRPPALVGELMHPSSHAADEPAPPTDHDDRSRSAPPSRPDASAPVSQPSRHIEPVRSRTPPPTRSVSQRTQYVVPPITTTRSGRKSKPRAGLQDPPPDPRRRGG